MFGCANPGYSRREIVQHYLNYADAVLAAHEVLTVNGQGVEELVAIAKPHWPITPTEAAWVRSSPNIVVKPLIKLFTGMRKGAMVRRVVTQSMHEGMVSAPCV